MDKKIKIDIKGFVKYMNDYLPLGYVAKINKDGSVSIEDKENKKQRQERNNDILNKVH